MDGITPKFQPKISLPQYRIGLNDREKTINAMIDEYLNNNTRKLFQKYNFIWKWGRREPFLGKTVKPRVKETYAIHLREKRNKTYEEIKPIKNIDKVWTDNLTVKITKSKAINHEFISLTNITIAINEYLLDPEKQGIDFINNIIKVANELKEELNAEVFFLQKNKIINDFGDVRVIMIVPTLIKIYESVIFNKIMSYLSELLGRFNYQYGGVIGGSTYQAMLKVKKLQNMKDSGGVILFDMAKGYDTVNLKILETCIWKIKDEMIRQLLLAWVIMVKNMDVIVNGEKIYRTRGIPMGLGLSPIIFVFYVHNALENIPKDKLAMYVDDIAMGLEKWAWKQSVHDINKLIEALARFELIINEKKTQFDTCNKMLTVELEKRFKRFSSTKYLGRMITVNGDGLVRADDRFVNLKGNRTNAMVYWATFFVKRIIFNAALDAKLRYKLLMWSTSSKLIRQALWKNNWSFFRKTMHCYSYVQLIFSVFNLFRYCIDIIDINKWKNQIKKKEMNEKMLKEAIIDKLNTGIEQIDTVLEKIDVSCKDISMAKDEFKNAKIFLDKLWDKFKNAAIDAYLERKKAEKIEVYENIGKFCKSKLFKSFSILQLVAFLHFNKNNSKNRIKDTFIIYTLLALYRAINNTISKVIYDNKDTDDTDDFNVEYIMKQIWIEYNDEQINSWTMEKWNNWRDIKSKELWFLIDKIISIISDSKLKGWSDVKELEDDLSKKEYVGYVDGAFNEKKKKVGYGWVLFHNNIKCESQAGELVTEEEKKLRNVAGELYATIELVDKAIEINAKEITIVFDYFGIVKYFNGEWRPKNNEYIKKYIVRMRQFSQIIKINFVKVSSHTGVTGNDEADRLSKIGAGMDGRDRVNKPKLIQAKVDFLKEKFKIIYKFLTIIEMIYLNSNLNNMSMNLLIMNAQVKYINLAQFLDKNYQLFDIENNLDPIDDKIYDVVID